MFKTAPPSIADYNCVVMVEDGDKKDDDKLEFDSTGQAVAYISLDQARVLAIEHDRATRSFTALAMPVESLYGRC